MKQEKKKMKKIQKIHKKEKKTEEKKPKYKVDQKETVTIKRSEVDFGAGGKQHSERAYVLQMINQIVQICNHAVLGEKDIPQDKTINSIIEELDQIANSDQWYYTNKIEELQLNQEQIDREDTLNRVEKGLIFIHVKTFLARSKGPNIWGEMQWKYSRSNAESLLIMLTKGIKQREIISIEIEIDDHERVIEATINYGENHIDTLGMKVEDIARRFFPNRKWQWKKYDKELNKMNTTNDLSYMIPPQKNWAKAD